MRFGSGPKILFIVGFESGPKIFIWFQAGKDLSSISAPKSIHMGLPLGSCYCCISLSYVFVNCYIRAIFGYPYNSSPYDNKNGAQMG